MPPPRRRFQPPHRCCLVWASGFGKLMLVCAHCHKPSGPKLEWAGGPDLLRLQIERSVAGHEQICPNKIRPRRSA